MGTKIIGSCPPCCTQEISCTGLCECENNDAVGVDIKLLWPTALLWDYDSIAIDDFQCAGCPALRGVYETIIDPVNSSFHTSNPSGPCGTGIITNWYTCGGVEQNTVGNCASYSPCSDASPLYTMQIWAVGRIRVNILGAGSGFRCTSDIQLQTYWGTTRNSDGVYLGGFSYRHITSAFELYPYISCPGGEETIEVDLAEVFNSKSPFANFTFQGGAPGVPGWCGPATDPYTMTVTAEL